LRALNSVWELKVLLSLRYIRTKKPHSFVILFRIALESAELH
jgi:hypothetical protein